MSTTERRISVLVAAATTLGAVELVRRDARVWRLSGARWWKIDYSAMSPLYAAISSVVLWVLVFLNEPPFGGLLGITLWLGVWLFLLITDDRLR